MASGSLPSAIEAALQAADPVELAARLVRIPSHPGIERQEEAVVRSLTEWLAAHGIESSLDEVAAGRPNLLVTLDSGRPGRHLVLCGHTDTVPLNRDDPGVGLSGEVRDGRLLGRGSVDMKGAVAAMAAAIVALETSGALEAGRVTLAAVVDEEMGGSGIDHLVATGFSADGAIVGEPSENRLLLGHKGLEWLEVRLAGASAHGGTPERGVNAIDAAARFLELVRSELLPRFAEREHPLLGRPTINAGTIRGGDQPSTVAASCAIAMDRRSVPGEDYASMTAELGELLDRVAAEMPGLEWSLGRVVGGSSSEEKLAFVTPGDHPLAAAVRRAGRMVGGEAPVEGAFPAWTDGGVLAAHGTPVVVLGPGDLSLAHSPREAVPVVELVEAARLYAASAVLFCAGNAG